MAEGNGGGGGGGNGGGGGGSDGGGEADDDMEDSLRPRWEDTEGDGDGSEITEGDDGLWSIGFGVGSSLCEHCNDNKEIRAR